MNGIIVDNFAGGGGASSGIERALGRRIDYAPPVMSEMLVSANVETEINEVAA